MATVLSEVEPIYCYGTPAAAPRPDAKGVPAYASTARAPGSTIHTQTQRIETLRTHRQLALYIRKNRDNHSMSVIHTTLSRSKKSIGCKEIVNLSAPLLSGHMLNRLSWLRD